MPQLVFLVVFCSNQLVPQILHWDWKNLKCAQYKELRRNQQVIKQTAFARKCFMITDLQSEVLYIQECSNFRKYGHFCTNQTVLSDLLFIAHKINLMQLSMQYYFYSRWLPSNNHLFALI